MNEKSTSELLDILKETKNIEEFEEYLNSIDTIKYTDFSKYIL